MEQKEVQLDQGTISCSICLDLLKDPVTISCGHNYCMDCIKTHWAEEVDCKPVHSCPQCTQTFKLWPNVVKNTMLAVLVEELKKTGLPAAPGDHRCAGPEDVACDVCTVRKLKAVKSCLVCLVSYCEEHPQPHYVSPAFESHKLVDPSKENQEDICPHDAAERSERQGSVEESQLNTLRMLQKNEKSMKVHQKEAEAINRSSHKAAKDSEKIFTQLIRLMENRRSDVTRQIRLKQETEVNRVKWTQKRLEREIAELKELSHTSLYTASPHSEPTDTPSISVRPLRYFENVTAAVSEIGDKLQDVLSGTWTNISWTVSEANKSFHEYPETRAEFLKYSLDLTLDPNTANTKLFLSEGNRKATVMRDNQSYPDHPDGFTYWYQVLSKESLTRCCYWEVKWKGMGLLQGGYVAVSYKSIFRDGVWNECKFGHNKNSWAFHFHSDTVWHNLVQYQTSHAESPTIGVYVDPLGGTVSFYSVCETMTLLYRVKTKFTEPLYAGLALDFSTGNTVELCKLE